MEDELKQVIHNKIQEEVDPSAQQHGALPLSPKSMQQQKPQTPQQQSKHMNNDDDDEDDEDDKDDEEFDNASAQQHRSPSISTKKSKSTNDDDEDDDDEDDKDDEESDDTDDDITGDGNTVMSSSEFASIIPKNTTGHDEQLHQFITSSFPGPNPYTQCIKYLAEKAEGNQSTGYENASSEIKGKNKDGDEECDDAGDVMTGDENTIISSSALATTMVNDTTAAADDDEKD